MTQDEQGMYCKYEESGNKTIKWRGTKEKQKRKSTTTEKKILEHFF